MEYDRHDVNGLTMCADCEQEFPDHKMVHIQYHPLSDEMVGKWVCEKCYKLGGYKQCAFCSKMFRAGHMRDDCCWKCAYGEKAEKYIKLMERICISGGVKFTPEARDFTVVGIYTCDTGIWRRFVRARDEIEAMDEAVKLFRPNEASYGGGDD